MWVAGVDFWVDFSDFLSFPGFLEFLESSDLDFSVWFGHLFE